MGLFVRREQDSTPDAALPFMTVAEAQEVRRLAAAAFAAAGHEVVIGDDRLTAADGQVYGLWNLAAACKAERTRLTWSKVVKRHVAQLLDVPPGPQDMAVEDVVAHAVLRVYGERQYPDGVLVAVPDRHHLMLHPIDDASVVPTLKAAAPAVAELSWSSAGRVSPSVSWWRDGRFDQHHHQHPMEAFA